MVVTEKGLIILDNKKSPYHIKLKDFNNLFKYLFYSLNLALHFNVMLAIRYNFWITPILILVNPDKFNYKKVSLPELQDNKRKKKKGKDKKEKRQSSIESLENLMALGYSLFEFIFLRMWDKIIADKATIDRFLDRYDLKFDSNKFDEFHKKAAVDIIHLFAALNNKVKDWYLNEEIDTSLTEITVENLSDFNFESFVQDFQETISKVYSQDSKEVKKKFKGLFIIFGLVSFFSPLGRINESLKEIIIEK